MSNTHQCNQKQAEVQGAASVFVEQPSRGFRGSLFRDQFASTVKTLSFQSPEQFARTLRTTTALSKSLLPWFKLAIFSGARTENGSRRCDAFVIILSGGECDYDAGEITVLDAALWLQAAGVNAIISETASSTPEEPRWRVWLPASREYIGTPDELRTIRQRWVARANGIVNGTLAGESFTLSQSYYIGGVKGRPNPTVIVTRGRRIDLCSDLDEGAIFKNRRNTPSERFQPAPISTHLEESDDDPLLLAECRRIVTNFVEKEGAGNYPQGRRSYQLVNWLGDLSTREGMTPSAVMIEEAIYEDFPETSEAIIEAMLARREMERGWKIINPKEVDLLDEDLTDVLDPAE